MSNSGLVSKQWRPIAGYGGLYEVSDAGEVMSLRYHKLLHPCRDKFTGYYAVSLTKDGKTLAKSVHVLVARAFIPNPENKPEVNHKDGDKSHNWASNLEWSTYKENMAHAFDNNICKRTHGINSPVSVFCVELDMVFKSISAAARYIGGDHEGIRQSMKHGIACKGYHFRRADE